MASDSKDKALRRLVVVQYERVKPGSPEIYRYNHRGRAAFAIEKPAELH